MKSKQYATAVTVLKKAIQSKGDAEVALEMRILAECYYLLKDYGKARTSYSKALTRQIGKQGKIICESRLAILAYKLKDYAGAREKIENFLRKYPTDKRAGILLTIKMKVIAAGRGSPSAKLKDLEPIYTQIANNKKRYGFHNSVIAGSLIGEMYIRANDKDKAITIFITAAHQMQTMITECKIKRRPIPQDLMQGFDSMCTQIAKYYVGKKDWRQAEKWLGNVGHVPDLQLNAKLLMAKIAYQRKDSKSVIRLLDKKFLATVPESETKANMHLLLGFAHQSSRRPNLERAKQCLKLVPRGATAYFQAQYALGGVYLRQKDLRLAVKHYTVSVKSRKFAPPSHFRLGTIYKQQADATAEEDEKLRKKRAELYQKSATEFSVLLAKYPLTSYAKQAKQSMEALEAKGAKVTKAMGEEDKVATWKKVVKEQPNTNEAAQALVSLAQYYSKELYDDKGKTIVKAPNWAACAESCDTLLRSGTKPFRGVSPERWLELRTMALLLRGKCELGSMPHGRHYRPPKGARPVTLKKKGSPDKAVDYFRSAMKLVKPTDRELQKELDLSLLEAMFKSKNADDRKKAEVRYAELRDEYSGDPRYQKLALSLADWFIEQQRYDLAAGSYRNLSKKIDLSRDQIMNLLYLAGTYYSKAARKVQKEGVKDAEGRTTCGLYVYPKELLQKPSILKTHRPFQAAKAIEWKRTKKPIKCEEILLEVSKVFGVPFVWSPDEYEGGVAHWLKNRGASYSSLRRYRYPRSLEEYLKAILNFERFRLDFDLGISGGTPTIKIEEVDKFDKAAMERAHVIQIYDSERERFAPLAKAYDWTSHARDRKRRRRGNYPPVMMFHVVKRIEELTGAQVVWAPTVEKEDVLAKEYTMLPGVDTSSKKHTREIQTASCSNVFRRTLEPLGLTFRLVRLDRAGELFDRAKESFSELRKYGADTEYVEKAMFSLAINFYYQEDYEKLRIVLREYLKVFDNPSHPRYYQACFWLGWSLEYSRNFRDAVKYYTQAAEESIVLYKLKPGVELPPKEELKSKLSYDTLFRIEFKTSGAFKDYNLADEFSNFMRFNTNIEMKLDPSAQAVKTLINREPFKKISCFDILYDVMKELGLGLRTEDADRKIAEKAYYRLASVYKKDNLMREALENINTLLDRFPDSSRRIDALKMKLDIYKGLKDYGKVLEALATLREEASDKIEPYKLDYEAGRVYFDMCCFAKAAGFYKKALAQAKNPSERLRIREAYAQALSRNKETWKEALVQYQALLKEEKEDLRLSINRLMAHHLAYALGQKTLRVLLLKEQRFIEKYEMLSEEQFDQLSKNDYARATWIYYILGLRDLRNGQLPAALQKFDAAGKSPDDYLASEALIKAGQIHLKRGDYKKARELFEYTLFGTKSVPGAVRATYYLGVSLKHLDRPDRAFRRFKEIVRKYPISPYASLVQKDPVYIEGIQKMEEPAVEDKSEIIEQQARRED